MFENKFTDNEKKISAHLDDVDIDGDIVATCEFVDVKFILSRNYSYDYSHSITFGESVSNYQWKDIVDFCSHLGPVKAFKELYIAMLYFNQGEHSRLFEWFNYLRERNPVVANIFNKFKEKQEIINTVKFFAEERARKHKLSTLLPKNASPEAQKMIETKIGYFGNLPYVVLFNIAKQMANSKFFSSEEAENIARNALTGIAK